MTDNSNKECVLYLKNRMGIVKMAALHGVAIIPTFTFNQVLPALCGNVRSHVLRPTLL